MTVLCIRILHSSGNALRVALAIAALFLAAFPNMSRAQVQQRYFGREGRSELCTHSIILKNGNSVAVGYAYEGVSSVGSDAFAMCVNRGDTLLWATELATSGSDRFIFAYPTRDTGFVAVGYAFATNSSTRPSALVVKFSATGAMQWSRMLKNSFNGEAFWTVTEVPSNGHIVCAGAYNLTPSTISSLLVDLDASGNVLWSKSYDNTGSDAMWGLVPIGADLFAMGYSQTGTLYDGYVMRVDESNGNIRWNHSFDFTSLINSNTGQWPQTLKLLGDRLYMDTYSFNAFSFNNVHHAIVSVDTQGRTPHCLEYKFSTAPYANSASSLIRSPNEIYLSQAPGTQSWDMQANTNNEAISDMTILKVRSLNAAGLSPVFCRNLGNPGAQTWRNLDYDQGKIISFQSSQGDSVSRLGYSDVFKLEADTAFTLTDTSCANDLPAPVFANPSVSINTNFQFGSITSITWPAPGAQLSFTPVSLESVQPCVAPDTIINRYAAVLDGDACTNSFLVDDPSGFVAGDSILIIQMKGAVIDSSNTASFGTVLDLRGAGLFERARIKSVTGSSIALVNRINPQFSIPDGKIQFVSIPRFRNLELRKRLTAMRWNGQKGGVCIFDVIDTLRLDAPVDVSGKGFAGGQASISRQGSCGRTDYFVPAANNFGAAKGEGIATLSPARMYGRGAQANGGGGGNDYNAGGGGGGNGGNGGLGGNQQVTATCLGAIINGGVGGIAVPPASGLPRAYLGGGGGAGHGNNGGAGAGGSGGGIVMLRAGVLVGRRPQIIADGSRAPHSLGAVPGYQDDGRGGGGGGGAIIAEIGNHAAAAALQANGGRGSGAYATPGTAPAAPGGGGGGGVIRFAGAAIPAGINAVAGFGANGATLRRPSASGGANAGNAGIIQAGFVQAPQRDSFVKNVITASISGTLQGCRSYRFSSRVTTSITGILHRTWLFGDGETSTELTPRHFFRDNGAYDVKLLLTDSNGCQDSAVLPLNIACRDTTINRYAAIIAADMCDNSFVVDSSAGFSAGDTVLLIQMQGAVIDSLTNIGYGALRNQGNAGNYELQLIARVAGNVITLRNRLSRQYDIGTGRVQLVRVPRFGNYTVNQPHVCQAWNGVKGGVLAMQVTGTLVLNDELDVSGRGFRGGRADTVLRTSMICGVLAPIISGSADSAARKGEGVALTQANATRGRGAWGNGGGGGNSFNTGGGGGSNIGAGGSGGKQSGQCANALSITNHGIGGWPLTVNPLQPRLYMGGGGGAGHANDGTPAHGGNGGGILLLNAATIAGDGLQLNAGGGPGYSCAAPGSGCQNDGSGGGGGGGSIMLSAGWLSSALRANTRGGLGGSVQQSTAPPVVSHGPGGGGGGGAIWLAGAAQPFLTADTAGGAAGVIRSAPPEAYFAVAGSGGLVLPGAGAPGISNQVFAGNTIRAGFQDTILGCFDRGFRSNSFTTTIGIAAFQWILPDLSNAPVSVAEQFTYTFPGYGTYRVRLIVTDSNGCKDSISKPLTILRRRFADAGRDTGVCRGGRVLLSASGGVRYKWAPEAGLTDPGAVQTYASVNLAQYYTVTVTDSMGCTDLDTILVRMQRPPNPVIARPADTIVCKDATIRLLAENAQEYRWSPGLNLSDSTSDQPLAMISAPVNLLVTARDSNGCISEAAVRINVHQGPPVDAYTLGESISCNQASIRIYASGAETYTWQPGHLLDDSTSKTPVLTSPSTILMRVTGTDRFGCTATDTLTVFAMTDFGLFMPDAFTPNGDGRNDEIRPYAYCNFELEAFRVFNRWGECVFYGYRPDHAWDGMFRGKQAEMGVYYYLILGRNKATGEPIRSKGDITLIR